MIKEFKPTVIYIKTHNITGLKYFGKTTRLDPIKYKGSGKYWLRHLNKYGNDVTTEILGTFFNYEECYNFAVEFSTTNNIVESTEWANLAIENGINGGLRHNSGENFRKINSKPRSNNHSKNISIGRTGTKMTKSSNDTRSLKMIGRYKNIPKPIVVCRLCDKQEMSAVAFAQWIRWNP